jgi:UDP-glucose 4-epimerase
VTDGTGFIGSHLTDRLVADGHHVTILENFSTEARNNLRHLENSPQVQIKESSILDTRPVDLLISESEMEYIESWYNRRRPHSYNAGLTPADALATYQARCQPAAA